MIENAYNYYADILFLSDQRADKEFFKQLREEIENDNISQLLPLIDTFCATAENSTKDSKDFGNNIPFCEQTAPNDLDIPQEPTQNDVIVKEVLQYSINYKDILGVSMLHIAYHWGIVFRILADEGLVTNNALNFCKYVESLGLNYPTNVKNPSKSSINRGTHDRMSNKTFDEWANNIPANDEKAKKMKAFGEDLKRKINELQHPKSEKSL